MVPLGRLSCSHYAKLSLFPGINREDIMGHTCKPTKTANREGEWVVEYYHGNPCRWRRYDHSSEALAGAQDAASGDHGPDVVYLVSNTMLGAVFRKEEKHSDHPQTYKMLLLGMDF